MAIQTSYAYGKCWGHYFNWKIYWALDCNMEIENVNTRISTTANLFRRGRRSIDNGQNVVIKDNKIVFIRNNDPMNEFDIYYVTTNYLGCIPLK